MGSCASNTTATSGKAYAPDASAKKGKFCDEALFEELETFGLGWEQVRKLHGVFVEVDLGDEGRVTRTDLFSFLEIESSVFNKRVFEMFDYTGRGWIDFCEFCAFAYLYCVQNITQLGMLTFQLYDTDKDGGVSVEELKELMKDANNFLNTGSVRHLTSNDVGVLNKLVQELRFSLQKQGYDEDENGPVADNELSMDINQFMSFVDTHKTILAPVHAAQDQIRKRILSTKFWTKLTSAQKKNQNCKLSNHIDFSKSNSTDTHAESVPGSAFLENIFTFKAAHVRGSVAATESKDVPQSATESSRSSTVLPEADESDSADSEKGKATKSKHKKQKVSKEKDVSSEDQKKTRHSTGQARKNSTGQARKNSTGQARKNSTGQARKNSTGQARKGSKDRNTIDSKRQRRGSKNHEKRKDSQDGGQCKQKQQKDPECRCANEELELFIELF